MNKAHISIVTCLFLFVANTCSIIAQGVAVNNNGSKADTSAILDVNSNVKGLLIPRMTTNERNNIAVLCSCIPAEGLMIFNTSTSCFEAFVNGGWYTVSCPATCVAPYTPSQGVHISNQTQIQWNWNSVPNAVGYKWNTVNDFNSAVDMGGVTSKTETGLTCGTNYTRYVWAYNACGSSVELSLTDTTSSCVFICGTSTVNDIDGNTYNTIQIGSQCWLKENLNVGTMIASLQSDSLTPITQTNNAVIEKYCYDYIQDGDVGEQAIGLLNCNTYGGIYQWAEAMNYKDGCSLSDFIQPSQPVQGICPSGWHIPSDVEWCTLELFVDPTVNCYGTSARGTDAGTRLKTDDISYPGNCNGVGNCNSSGFSALAGGYRYDYGGFAVFSGFGVYSTFWSSTQGGAGNLAWDRYETNDARTTRFEDPKLMGCSIRCVKD